MTTTSTAITSQIVQFINSYDANYANWYVGIAANPADRLFNGHGVFKDQGYWIYRTAENSPEARAIENYFINTLKTDGGSGGGDYMSRSIYAYRKTNYTRE